jgi:carboxyvinyl-carboxyphosphonate phosphorylmutase
MPIRTDRTGLRPKGSQMNATVARRRLRAILDSERCVTMGSVYDPVSARIADDLGYEAALMGGSVVSHVMLAAPDVILLTLSELAEQVSRCMRASAVPIVVDGDHGYGNALNAMRTVQEMDRAGAGAVMIEDTVLPRPFGPGGGAAHLLPHDESAAKIRAAVEARGESDLVVLGRTGAATITGVDDAIERFRAFEAAGVDALFIPGIASRSDLDRLSTALKLPLILGGVSEDLADPVYLASRRVRLWSAGHQVFAVAVKALYDAMKSVHEGVLPAKLSGIASPALMDRITRVDEHHAWTKRFLGGR